VRQNLRQSAPILAVRGPFDKPSNATRKHKRGWRAEGIRIAKFKATIPFIDKPLADITSDDWPTWRDLRMFGWTDMKMALRYFNATAADIAAKLD